MAPGRTNNEEIKLIGTEIHAGATARAPLPTVTPTAPGDVNATPVTVK